jgi:hypothetical protein
VLSVPLRLMASDYPVGIFKHVLSFFPFSFGYCVVYHSSIYGFCLPFGIFLISRFMCILLWIIVRSFVFFLSATMLSVFLPFTASGYPFVIFKQFFSIDQAYINYAAGTSGFSKDSMLVIFLVFCVVLCFRPVSYVPSVVSVSRLSILDCPFGILSCLVNRIE